MFAATQHALYAPPAEALRYLPILSREIGADVYAVLGGTLPSKSIKYISVLGMLNYLRQSGVLAGCKDVVASSSGNTAEAAGHLLKDTRFVFHAVVDPRLTERKRQALRQLGVDLIEVKEADPVTGYLGARLSAVRKYIEAMPGAVDLDQYSNIGALNGHFEVTGPWLWEQMRGRIDLFVAPIGTGGTFGGTAYFLLRTNLRIMTVPVDCEGSAIFGGQAGPHLVTGIGAHFPCENVKLAYRAVRGAAPEIVCDAAAIDAMHWLKEFEGIGTGGSGGAALVAVRRLARQARGGKIVVILPDGDEQYLDTLFNETWLQERGIRVGHSCRR
jgi:cysteine synthase